MGALYYYPALQVAAMLDRVLSEASKIPELESLIAEVIQVDVERLIDSRLLSLSRELGIDLFTERSIIVDIKMVQKIIQLAFPA